MAAETRDTYDVSIGACRAAIDDELNAEYLLVADSDLRLRTGLGPRRLQRVLEHRSGLGGVSGVLFEDGEMRAGRSNPRNKTLAGRTCSFTHPVVGRRGSGERL